MKKLLFKNGKEIEISKAMADNLVKAITKNPEVKFQTFYLDGDHFVNFDYLINIEEIVAIY